MMNWVRLVDADPACNERWLISANRVCMTRHIDTSSRRSGSTASWQSSLNRKNLPESPSALQMQNSRPIGRSGVQGPKPRARSIESKVRATTDAVDDGSFSEPKTATRPR
jgi:hypothetical protein